MQSYEQACIHVDESLSINELWHATLLQTSTPGGGRGEERRVGRAGPGWGWEWGVKLRPCKTTSLQTDDVAASLGAPLHLFPTQPLCARNHVDITIFCAKKKKETTEVETCSRLRQLRKETPD